MQKNIPRQKYKKSLKMEIASWCWDSHYWIEKPFNYWQCKWCGSTWTSECPITENYNNLCEKNPIIKRAIINIRHGKTLNIASMRIF